MTKSGASRVRRQRAALRASRHGSLRPAAGEFIASVTGPGNLFSPPLEYRASHAPAGVVRVDAGARPSRCRSDGRLFGIRTIANSDHLTLGNDQFDAKSRKYAAWGSGLQARHSRQSPWPGRTSANGAQIRSAA